MIESLDDLKECAMNALQPIGEYDLMPDKNESVLEHDLLKFLKKPFKELIELVMTQIILLIKYLMSN